MGYVDEFIHSCYVRCENDSDAIIVKVHRHDLETKTITPAIKIIRDPVRPFYITKKGRQTHKLKKEWEDLDALDQYIVPQSKLGGELFRALNGFYPKRKSNHVREICNSPYVYGADISIETLIKRQYQDEFAKSGLQASKITTGFLDTELSVLQGSYGRLILITVTHENKVYTAILDSFFFKVDKITGNRTKGDLGELQEFVVKTFDEYIKKHAFTFEYFIGNTEVDLIRWIFAKIHENRTDFIGIWNMDFDISVIIDILNKNDIPLENVFCPKNIPNDIKYVRYVKDTKDVQHWTLKWHFLHNASYSQFVDSMSLYSILRIVKGKETSYALDYILKSNKIGNGKLTFKDDNIELDSMSKLDWHRHMQTYEFYKYVAYNQFDAMSIQLLEWKNSDISAMYSLVGSSHLSSYNKTTRRVVDSMYFYCLERGKVLAACGTDMSTEYDQLVSKTGGAVLKPENTYRLGLNCLQDAPQVTTMLSIFAGDLDFSSLYPNVQCAINTARETKISTGVTIEGHSEKAMQAYHSMLISTVENSVKIASKYFGLPDYTEFERLFKESLMSKK